MRLIHAMAAGALSVTTLCFASGPSDTGALKERLHRAEVDSSIDAEGVAPWHLKLSVQLYDAKGQQAQVATIEEWHVRKNASRIVYTMPESTTTEVRNEKGLFLDGVAPMTLQTMLEQIVHPMPTSRDIDDSLPEMDKQNFGKVSLECVMLSQPFGSAVIAPMGLFPTYCFDPGANILRASYNYGSQLIVRNSIGTFLTHHLATDVTIRENGVTAAKAKVVDMSTIEPGTAELDKVENLQLTPSIPTLMSGGVVAGTVINKVQPMYPANARRNHISGTVVLHAVIGRDGHIRFLRVIKAPDGDLALAALWAVRQWTYKPYTVNAQPAQVDTTISVNFNIE